MLESMSVNLCFMLLFIDHNIAMLRITNSAIWLENNVHIFQQVWVSTSIIYKPFFVQRFSCDFVISDIFSSSHLLRILIHNKYCYTRHTLKIKTKSNYRNSPTKKSCVIRLRLTQRLVWSTSYCRILAFRFVHF